MVRQNDDLRSGGCLISEEAALWSERWGTSFRFKPKGSHASIVERHHQIMRDQIHKILAQARLEKIKLDSQRMLAEAVYAKNIMTSVHGVSPYVALYGRYPAILKEMEDSGLSLVDDSSGTHKHATRLRELAMSSIIEGVSQDRLRQAARSKARSPGQLLELSTGDLVDIYRSPDTKDLVGWRGPCEVVNTQHIEEGTVDVRWNGRTIAARVADVRAHIHYTSVFFGFLDSNEMFSSDIRSHL